MDNSAMVDDVSSAPSASASASTIAAFNASADNNEDCYMKIDAAAQSALNLFPSKDASDKYSHVYGVLQHGKTNMSKRLLREWIEKPLVDVEAIRRRQNYVELFMSDHDVFQALQTQLKHMPDIDKLIKKIEQSETSRKESTEHIKTLLEAYEMVRKFPVMIDTLGHHTGNFVDLVSREIVNPSRAEIIPDVSNYNEMVDTTIDVEASEKYEYRVRPNFRPEFQVLYTKLEARKAEMEEVRSQACRALSLEEGKVKLTHVPAHQWCLKVTRKDAETLHGVREYILLETRKDGVYFTTSSLRNYNEKRRIAEAEYEKLQEELVREAMSVARSYLISFRRINSIVTELDVLLGFAHAATHASIPYVRPELLPVGSGVIELEEARHPCVEQSAKGGEFIPNSVKMEQDSSRVQIVTGPNMGGKSTYIRMAGVLVVMAQIGSFLPCTSARLSVQKMILARVGAGDNQQKGMSTFMAEMLEASAIVNKSTEHALVIIDELGRGTSTYDGFGLAWAICEHLTKVTKCFTFFATHFAELPALAQQHSCVKNLHVTAHVDDSHITMLYKVLQGASTSSFGVHVAQVANFPASVVRAARAKAKELETFGGNVDSILNLAGSAAADINNASSSTPPSSQEASPARVRPTAASTGNKRVSSESDNTEVKPVPSVLQELLLSKSASDFKDSNGVVDKVKFRAYISEMMQKDAQGALQPTAYPKFKERISNQSKDDPMES